MVAGNSEDDVFDKGARALVQSAEGVGAAKEREVERVGTIEDGACFLVYLLVEAQDRGNDRIEWRVYVRKWTEVTTAAGG